MQNKSHACVNTALAIIYSGIRLSVIYYLCTINIY